MKLNLSFKIIGALLLVTILAFSFFTYFRVRQHRALLEESYLDKAKAITYALDAGIANREALEVESKLLSNIYKLIWLDPDLSEISINLPQQDVLVTFASNNQNLINQVADADNLESYKSNLLIHKFIRTKQLRLLRVIAPIHVSGQVAGTYQIDLTLEDLDDKIARETRDFVLEIFFLIVLSSMIIFIQGVLAIAQGNLDYKIKAKSNDEIGQLGKAFNQMAKDLKDAHNNLVKHEKELEKTVEKRTNELQSKMAELEKFNKLAVGRELRMVELKKKIAELEKKKEKNKKSEEAEVKKWL
jgi:methyl-accepting chemotaxis protein